MQSRWFNGVLVICLVLMWGTSFMFMAIALEGGFTPIAITLLRLVLGALTLVAVVYWQGLRLPVDAKSWGAFLLFGLLGAVAPFFCIAYGQQTVPSGTAGVLIAVMPLVTIALAHYVVPNERLNRYKIIGMLTAFGGVYLLLRPDQQGHSALVGELSILAGATFYAINTVLVRLLPHYHPLVGSAGMLVGAAVLMVPAFLYFGLQLPAQPGLSTLFAVIWMGVIPTGLATLVYFMVIERGGPSYVANCNFMVPVVAFISGIVVLNEVVTLANVLALAVILTGIATSRYQPAV